ncbi:MAG TPA: hypothetical protein VGO45_05125 [Bacteroidia bacterium]|jgi:hypothetical protein|nr:hypothetical protein [Bacteroidia bacterium]
MKQILTLFALAQFILCSNLPLKAAQSGTIRLKIQGACSDVTTGVFVQLHSAKDSALVQTGLTEANGTVEFTGLPYERYYISVEHVNCKPLSSTPVEVSESTPLINMASVQLESYKCDQGPSQTRSLIY